MAKYTIEYDIHIGDSVRFRNRGVYQYGIIQDITQMPDIWVEGFEDGKYKRWCCGIESLEILDNNYDSVVSTSIEVTEGEAIEFVHGGDVGTPDFNQLIFKYYNKSNKI